MIAMRKPKDTTRGKMMALPPCLVLKSLRERAGLSGSDCALQWRSFKQRHNLPQKGRKTSAPPAPTTWYRYESVEKHGDRPIRDDLIAALIPLFVGKGNPPITQGELEAISVSGKIGRSNVPRVSSAPDEKQLHRPRPALVTAENGQLSALLPIKYRAERGTYFEASRLGYKTLGDSIISASSGGDFAVAVSDDHAHPIYPPGTILDCQAVQEAAPSMRGKRAVVFSTRHGSDLGEVLVANIESVVGSTFVLKTIEGETVDGTILGLIRGHYSPD